MRIEIKRLLQTLLVITLIAALGFPTPSYARGKTKSAKKNFLWEIKSPTNTVYILGSIHLLKASQYPLDRVIEKAYANSEKLVFEIDLSKIKPYDLQKMLFLKGFYKIPDTLQKNVSPETYELVKKRAEEIGINELILNTFEPWSLASVLSMSKITKLGFEARHGLDRHFMKRAKEDGKEILELETFEYQIDIFDNMPPDEQEWYLLKTITDMDRTEELMDDMINAWANGDTEKLGSIMSKEFKEFPRLEEALLPKRNKEWMPKIEEFLKEDKNYLIIVGAGHLVGTDGVIELLHKKGYKIKQL